MKILQFAAGLILATAAAKAQQQYTISTIAGIGQVRGWFGDGFAANNAQLNMPLRVAVDSKGNYYFVDYQTHVVREVTVADGKISTVAGDGTYGFQGDNGIGTQAKFSDIHGLAVDSSGNLYIADTSNHRVRKLDSKGNVTTFAGNGNQGYTGDGALATSAELSLPAGLAVDSGGNVYIGDYGNSTVRKVDSKGNISTVAGTGVWGSAGDGGPANKATLGAPVALAFDPGGNLYVADTGSASVRKVGADGNIQTVASNVDVESLAVDAAGVIYYPDYLTSTVAAIAPGGQPKPIAGNGTPGYSGDGGPANFGQLNLPYGVALGAGGTIYVADSGNQTIRLLTPVSFGLGAIVNAASGLSGPITPGEIVVIYGSGIGPANLTVAKPDANGNYGPVLAGTVVAFDSWYAPILYASANQVAVVVPYEEPIGNTAQVSVGYNGATTLPAAVSVLYTAPGIFTANGSGSGQAAAVNQDGKANSASNPAARGSFISLYATGEGQTNPGGVDGKAATVPLPKPNQPVSVTIGGKPAVVSYAGGAPGQIAGLMQVNVQIPTSVTPGAAVPVVVYAGGAASQLTATIAVQ